MLIRDNLSPQQMDELRAGVRVSLPEIATIADTILQDQVVEAWAIALSQTEFNSIDEIPASAHPNSPPIKGGTQATHLRGVARMAVRLGETMNDLCGPLDIDVDQIMAAGLCHDLGKAWEFSPTNQKRWSENPAKFGYPSLRHPVYGAHVALLAGLPEGVVHAAAAHSAEGEAIQRSLENTLVHYADYAFWDIVKLGGRLEHEILS